MKKIIILTLSVICAFAVIIGFAFNDSPESKAYAAEGYVAGTDPTLGNTMFKVSSDGSALLLATAIENFDDVYQVGYDITVSTGDVDKINAPISRYYSSLTLGEKTWYPSEIFGDAYADAKMIIWEIGYNSSYTYTIKAHAYVGYRRTSDNALFDAATISADEIKVEQVSANVLSLNHTLSFENGDEVIDDKAVSIGSPIGTLPEISIKPGYTASAWKIGETTITAETKWRWSSDKTAVATYIENPIHDNSDHYAKEFDLSSASDYTIATNAIDDSFAGTLVAVHYNDAPLSCSFSNGNIVIDGDDMREIACGDRYLNVYTTTDTYKIKVLLITKIITSVSDLNAMAAYGSAHTTAHTGYYVLGNDIDGGGATVNSLSQYCGGGSYTTNGFRGVFDGRGHIISNVTLANGFLFNGIGKDALVKDFAIIDPVLSTARSGVLAGEIQGASISNVLVRSSTVSIANGGLFNASSAENVIFISTGGTGTKRMIPTLTDGSTLNNAIYVAESFSRSDTFGYGTHTVTNAKAYDTIGEMIEDLSESNAVSAWDSPYIAYNRANKQLKFSDTPVYINADIELGTAFNISGINGNVTAFRTLSGDRVDLASNNVITADELYDAAGVYWSESLAVILITSNNDYLVNASFATKIITSVQGLNAMATYGASHASSHTGYYILGNDIDCGGATVNSLSQYCGGHNYTTNGFRGVFDGRGHVISNATLASGYLFSGIGKDAVIKNFALIDPVQSVVKSGVLAGEVQGATVSNVLVRSACVSIFNGGMYNTSSAENLVFISTGGTGLMTMMPYLADDSTLNSAIYVAQGHETSVVNTFGYGTHTVTSAYAYDTTAEMLGDLSANNYISDWGSPYIAYDDTCDLIRFGDFLLIDADIELGEAFNIGCIDGDVVAIKCGNGSRVDLAQHNVITADELYEAAGVYWSEGLAIKLITNNNSYHVNAAFITKIITSVQGLNEMAAYGSANETAHTGYYVLGSDIDCGGATVNALSQYCGGASYTTNGFRGVFDGRGHVISGARLASGYLFNGLGENAVVKNFALVDPVQTVGRDGVLANRIHSASIRDVFVISETVSMANGLYNAAKAENVMFISTGAGTKKMFGQIAGGSSVNNAVIAAEGCDQNEAFGSIDSGTVANAHAYSSTSAMIGDLSGKNYIFDWNSRYFSYEQFYVSGNKLRKRITFNDHLIEKLDYTIDAKYVLSVPVYANTGDKIVSSGSTDYLIVIAHDADASVYNAAIELSSLVYEATGASLTIVSDKDVTWSETAKLISLGDNLITDAAGSVRPDLNERGYSIKRIGKSLFLRGSRENGTVFSVYGLLNRILGFECYSPDEYEIAKTSDLYLPDINITDEPDIGFMMFPTGLTGGNYRQRLNYTGTPFMYPEGAGPYHNSFDYFPPAVYQSTHPNWYSNDGKQLCYTAHGNASEYSALVSATVEKMKAVITNNPDGKTITFTQQDVVNWCDCSACSSLNSTYGTDSAAVIRFMNDVVEQVEAWREATFPERDDIRYMFFAYCTTGDAPVKTVNGNYVPKDETVRPNEKIGVLFVMSQDTADTRAKMQRWHALVGENLYCWFYQTYFKSYFVPYSDFTTIQGHFQAMEANGTAWLYYQSQWNNNNTSSFEVLKAYLESKLSRDVDANVATLTDNFFKYYFRDASASMRSYYNEISSTFTNTDFGSTEETLLNKSVLTQSKLLTWQGYIDAAYAAISGIADPQLRSTIYDRIKLESLSVRYMLIKLYGTEIWTSSELTEQKLLFKKDCKDLNVTKVAEHTTVDELWPEAIIPTDAVSEGNFDADNTYGNGGWISFD